MKQIVEGLKLKGFILGEWLCCSITKFHSVLNRSFNLKFLFEVLNRSFNLKLLFEVSNRTFISKLHLEAAFRTFVLEFYFKASFWSSVSIFYFEVQFWFFILKILFNVSFKWYECLTSMYFLEVLHSNFSSIHHAYCANALQKKCGESANIQRLR